MPRGFLAEDGLHPEFEMLYGMRETDTADYNERTARNAFEADLTLWFGTGDSGGRDWTLFNCQNTGKPYIDLPLPHPTAKPNEILPRLTGIRTVNVAGHRESVQPGIQALTEAYLTELFQAMQQAGAQRSEDGPDCPT
jgi:hypothetical protein